jgi:magnesium transporter
LLASVAGGIGAAFLIGLYEKELTEVAALAAFIPIVMGLGGNVGVQASTIAVRGIAMGQLDPSKLVPALVYELRVVLVIALVCAGIVAVVCFGMADYLVDGGPTAPAPILLAGAVSNSLLVVMIIGAMLGTAVPLIAHRVGIDPAVATGPVLTTTIDLVGVLLYFLISVTWLGL